MKKVLLTLMCVAAMMAVGTGLKAQEVTITIMPGCNWISVPLMDTLDFQTALGSFIPEQGDIIKSKWNNAHYRNGQWVGRITQFYPGYGYMYISKRTMPVLLTFNVQQPVPQVVVTTTDPTAITTYSATCGGMIGDEVSDAVLVRGVCWSTIQNPTITDSHTTDSYGTGNFSSFVEGLEMNTTYYVRAYALTISGVGYGEQKMFSTKNGVPTLTTSAASEIGVTWATCGGDISDDGGMEITERGICWSTDHNPTIEGSYGANGAGLGSFSVNMNNLEPNTMYYVRAYATNGYTTSYGNEVSFRTEVEQTWPNGKLPGQFSVSETHQVQFSQGNLLYKASTNNWSFAPNQLYYIGDGNSNISSSYNGYIDLFGWATSGYNHGAICYQPWSTSTSWGCYYAYGEEEYSLSAQTGMADWGYNSILNGGGQENFGWRTLSSWEWQYILYYRTTVSGIRYAKAQVNGINGVILLPDDWSESLYSLEETNMSEASFNSNIITAMDWTGMEQNGAVFLPTAGVRYGTSVNNIISEGHYWSETAGNNTRAVSLYFKDNNLTVSGIAYGRDDGRNVRLVRSIPVYSIEATPNPAEGGTVTGQGNYNSDATCTLTATPNEGYVFNNWTENGTVVSTDASYSFTVTSDRTLVANFMQVPTGAIAGLFTVNSNGNKVYFSQGNLQYIGSATIPYWKFADNQWDYLGATTGQNSSDSDVDRDLFGWGTSGYNHGAVCYWPWSTSTNNSDYYAYGNYSYDLSDLTGKADWGYNPISNGGNTPNTWHTLTNAELVYLFNTRNTNSGVRYVKAKVNGVNGLVLLPDNWNTAYHSLNNINPTGSCDFDSNIISYSDWMSDFLPHGAVFLPAAGIRNGTSASSGFDGNYWSASSVDNQFAGHAGFNNGGVYFGGGNDRKCGFSVRLVHNAE